jgi:hypothetical protein
MKCVWIIVNDEQGREGKSTQISLVVYSDYTSISWKDWTGFELVASIMQITFMT